MWTVRLVYSHYLNSKDFLTPTPESTLMVLLLSNTEWLVGIRYSWLVCRVYIVVPCWLTPSEPSQVFVWLLCILLRVVAVLGLQNSSQDQDNLSIIKSGQSWTLSGLFVSSHRKSLTPIFVNTCRIGRSPTMPRQPRRRRTLRMRQHGSLCKQPGREENTRFWGDDHEWWWWWWWQTTNTLDTNKLTVRSEMYPMNRHTTYSKSTEYFLTESSVDLATVVDVKLSYFINSPDLRFAEIIALCTYSYS